MIGRLPNRSDKTPSQGEQKNCSSAKTTANRALHFAASVISPPRKSRISFGKTGMIKPIAKMSSVTVTRMKMTAAGRAFIEYRLIVKALKRYIGSQFALTGHRKYICVSVRQDASYLLSVG